MGTGDALRFQTSLVKGPQDQRDRAQSISRQTTCRSLPKSKSIPILKSRQDYFEELEIQEQEVIAEERDYCMFHRIVTSMIAKRCAHCGAYTTDSYYHYETEKCIANIMRTRHKNIDVDEVVDDPVATALNQEVCCPVTGAGPDANMPPEQHQSCDEGVFVMDM